MKLLPLAFLVSVTLAPGLRVTELEAGVYVVRHDFPWQSNSLVMRMENGDVVLVDTPATPEATECLLNWTEKILHPDSITAVVTHYHLDRLGGAAALKKHGIPIHGSSHTVRLMKEKGEEMRRLTMSWVADESMRAAYAAIEMVPPDQVFDEKKPPVLEFGDDRIEILYPGPGHTDDNLLVWEPRRHILFGGCFLIASPKLGNLIEADPRRWLTSLATIADRPARFVIASHADGWPAFSPAIVANTERLLKERLANGQP